MTIELLQVIRKNGMTTGRCRDSVTGDEKFFSVVANISNAQLIEKIQQHLRSSRLRIPEDVSLADREDGSS